MAGGDKSTMQHAKTLNHEEHEVSRRILSVGFLRAPSCPLWLTVSPFLPEANVAGD